MLSFDYSVYNAKIRAIQSVMRFVITRNRVSLSSKPMVDVYLGNPDPLPRCM